MCIEYTLDPRKLAWFEEYARRWPPIIERSLEVSNPTEGSDAMKYMLLIYQGTSPTPRSPDSGARLSEDERRAVFDAYQEVNKTPGVTPGVVLQPADKTATTVRVEAGETQAVDGPFVPSEQALDGYLMFESDDPHAAVELVARIPAARMGSAVEVRPVLDPS